MGKLLFKLNKKLSQGIGTLCKVEKRKMEDIITKEITNNFVILHFGQGIEDDFQTIKQFLIGLDFKENEFQLDIYPGYCHGFLAFKNKQNSMTLVQQLLQKNNENEKLKLKDNFKNIGTYNNEKMTMLKHHITLQFTSKERFCFFLPTKLEAEQMHCRIGSHNSIEIATKDYDQYKDKGLTVIKDLITVEQEQQIFDNFKKKEWDNLSHRRVQHYGYRFIYGVNSVNKKKELGKIPKELLLPLEQKKFQDEFKINENYFDQCTINEYKPGAGIPPHTDSHAPFEELLVSISLFSDIVMTFENPETNKTFSVLVPRRSAIAFTKEIRYLWKHSIAARKIDRLNNGLLFRRTRYSLTFRKTKQEPNCDCKYQKFCDYQISKQNNQISKDQMKEQNFEQMYVKNVYNSISEHFSHTRYKPWPSVKDFLLQIPQNSLVGDIGCGNGKYMICTDRHQFIGTDIAFKFTEIVKQKNNSLQVAVGDITSIPIRSNVLDYAISIAVVHHLSNEQRRIQAIGEMLRIIKTNGEILVYVWAFEQDKDFGGTDIFVPWNNQHKYEVKEGKKIEDKKLDEKKNTIVYKRYYHLFKKGELDEIVNKAGQKYGYNIEIIDSYYSHQNWAIRLTIKPTCAKLKYDSEWFGKMDPYAVLTIGSQTYKTHTANDAGKNPTWTDQFTFSMKGGESQLYIKIYDKDIGSKDDFICEGAISLMQVLQMGSVSEWFPLTRKGKKAGQIMLVMNYMGTNQGYPPQGYPPQGYPPQGYPPQGYPPQGYPPQGYPPQGYPPQGYPPQGYPPQGYPPQGYPPQGNGYGYPPQGYY